MLFLILVKFFDQTLNQHLTRYRRGEYETHLARRRVVFYRYLDDIQRVCRERGIPFMVVRQQAREDAQRRDIKGLTYAEEYDQLLKKLDGEGVNGAAFSFLTHCGLMRELPDWAEANNVVIVDGIAALDQRRDTLVSAVHLNPEGNHILAGAIADEIIGRGLLLEVD